MGSPSAIITLGYGDWGSVGEVVTLGYGSAVAVATLVDRWTDVLTVNIDPYGPLTCRIPNERHEVTINQ